MNCILCVGFVFKTARVSLLSCCDRTLEEGRRNRLEQDAAGRRLLRCAEE
jgi:hypothetical protein